jgi:predicted permease
VSADPRPFTCICGRFMTLVENVCQDLRYAIRMLRLTPAFAVVALLSLALGIGANTAIFQLLNAVKLRSLPVKDPQQLAVVRIRGGNLGLGLSNGYGSDLTYPLWQGLRDRQQAFSGIFAMGKSQFLVGSANETQPVESIWVSGEVFDVLGVKAQRGRLFNAADDRPGCAFGTAVISYAFWQRYLAGEESAIGRTLTVLDKSVQVIGITPRGFTGLEVGQGFDIAFPMCAEAVWGESIKRSDIWWLTVMGRLKPGWSVERAAAHFDAISPALFEATPLTGYDDYILGKYRQFRLTAQAASNGTSLLRKNYETPLWLLLGITGFVLLVASVNIANLMLARATAREHEIAVRIAVGASRRRLISQMFAESVLLAGLGALAAIGLAPLLSRTLVGFLATENETVLLDLSLDWRVLLFTAGVAILTCIGFGLVPAFRSTVAEPGAAMKAVGRGLTSTRNRFSYQRTLVVVQIAVSLILVFGALLFVRSLRNLTGLDAGFRPGGLVFATAGQPMFNMPPGDRPDFQLRVLEEVRSIPYVQSAALSTHIPLVGASWSFIVNVTTPQSETKGDSRFTYISPQYFRTMDTPILQGRDFDDRDTTSSVKVAIVNQTFVRQYILTPNPIGTIVRTIAEPGFPSTIYQVVGVVKDTKYTSLRDDMPPIAFVPFTQNPQPAAFVRMVIRYSESNTDVVAEIKRRIGESHPGMTVQFRLLETLIRDGVTLERLMAWLSGFFGMLAALLAVIGLYGVLSYMTQKRKGEIGIRMALGATRLRVVALIIRETAVLLVVGIAIGALVSQWVTRAMQGLLFELSPTDFRTMVAAASALTIIAVFASYVPAWRASRVDPMIALRHD